LELVLLHQKKESFNLVNAKYRTVLESPSFEAKSTYRLRVLSQKEFDVVSIFHPRKRREASKNSSR